MKAAEKSEERNIDKRKRHAEAQKRYKEKNLAQLRESNKNIQNKKRTNMTKVEKDSVRARDRECKAKKRIKIKENEIREEEKMKDKKKELDSHPLKKSKLRQKKNNIRIQRKIRDGLTEEQKERRNAEQATMMREMRSDFTRLGKKLARRKARKGMRVCRKFGYLKTYKQRKSRCEYDAYRIREHGTDKNGFTWFFKERMQKYLREYRKKQESEETERKENLKRMNRVRVQRHRLKVKKMLEEPVIIDSYGKKGEYEMIRERNIREFEKLKKESGLFD